MILNKLSLSVNSVILKHALNIEICNNNKNIFLIVNISLLSK